VHFGLLLQEQERHRTMEEQRRCNVRKRKYVILLNKILELRNLRAQQSNIHGQRTSPVESASSRQCD